MKVDLNKIYNQYLSNFDGNTAIITTPYKPLDCFYIKFDILQLPHLLGLHKIYRQKPKDICSQLNNSVITYDKIQRHANFGQVRDRINYFGFILDIFLEGYNDSVIYVSENDKKGSSMGLDIAFAHPHKDKYLTLGLRENISSIYAPVTFYVNKKIAGRRPFNNSKRAKILTLEMIKDI